MNGSFRPKTTALLLILAASASACGDDPQSDHSWRSDDFDGADPQPWNVFHPQYADTSIVDGRLLIRPDAFTVWWGNNEAYHHYVMVTGDFMMTAHVEIGDLAGGPALPDWRFGGLMVRDTAHGPVAAYQVALGTLSAELTTEMVAQHKSTEGGSSAFGFIPNNSGVGELRLCRVGSEVQALFRPDSSSEWITLDQRARPDLPETLAAGPMAYAYSAVGDFEAAFDYVDFETPTTVDDCTADGDEDGQSTGGTGAGDQTGGSSTSGGESGESTSGDESGQSTGDGSGQSTGDGSGQSTGGGAPVHEVPLPTAPCPPLQDGVVTFCPAGLGGTCRDVNISNVTGGSPSGPLLVHWHGTGESPDGLLAWDSVTQQLVTTAVAEDGIMVLPYADPDALARPVAFPWWVVGDPSDPQMEVHREDDFLLLDEVAACVVEAGLASADRINVSGFSAGGILSSHVIERRDYFASAVSWSGGMPPTYQPVEPMAATAVMAIHGGPTDLYCGAGVQAGGCFDFVGSSEALAAGVVSAGHWAFVCDHRGGHSPHIGLEGSQFMALASRSAPHPWTDYAFGGGANWVLDNYCHASGEPSPWD